MLRFSKHRDYLLLLAAAFCWGSSLSQLTMLAVVLRDHGMSAPMVATVLSASTVAMLLASLTSGPLASRLGATRTLLIGAVVALAAIAVLPFAVDAAPLATLAMAGRGLGAGLFTPSGQLFAQAQARADDRTRAVGMFTAMFLIPNFFGPALGEWSLRHLGEIGFLLLPILPMVAALLLVCWLRQDDTPAPPNNAGYLALLRDHQQWLPNLATMQSGLAYAFAASFLPLLLVERNIAVAAFFSPFAVVLLVTRFAGLKYLQRLSAPVLAGCGLFSYASGFYTLNGAAWLGAPLAGALFGFAYGVILPTCVTWSTRHYLPAERARPVALVNTSFQIGSIIAMQLTGAALTTIGWFGVLTVLDTMITLVLIIIVGHLIAANLRGAPQSSSQATARARWLPPGVN
jgi:MFS family permease